MLTDFKREYVQFLTLRESSRWFPLSGRAQLISTFSWLLFQGQMPSVFRHILLKFGLGSSRWISSFLSHLSSPRSQSGLLQVVASSSKGGKKTSPSKQALFKLLIGSYLLISQRPKQVHMATRFKLEKWIPLFDGTSAMPHEVGRRICGYFTIHHHQLPYWEAGI